jgi:PAS domain S-box-containing protein
MSHAALSCPERGSSAPARALILRRRAICVGLLALRLFLLALLDPVGGALAGEEAMTLQVLRVKPEARARQHPLADCLPRALSRRDERPDRPAVADFSFAVYPSADDALRESRPPLFDRMQDFTLRDAWMRYRYPILFLSAAGALVLFMGAALLCGGRRLAAARREARDSETRLAEILDNVGAYIYIKDRDYRYRFANRAVCELFGATPAQVHGREDADFFDAATAARLRENDRRVVEGGERIEIAETNFVAGARAARTYLSVKLPLRDEGDQIYALCGISTDITERMQAEDEIKRSNAELEQFAYAISHDMRQPLRMIANYLQLLAKSLGERLDEDERQFLAFAVDGAQRMDRMILSLLEYSRVGRMGEPKARVSSREALDEALALFGPEIAATGADVKIAGEWPDIVACRDELTRLFQNLIGNALKYREAGQAPRVEVRASCASGRFRAEVRDHGIGIDPAQTGRLFKMFSRLQARSRFDGAGVGLALCRKIVEGHGGQIGVESPGEGGGSLFWFEIPGELSA